MSMCKKFMLFCFCAMLVGLVLIREVNANEPIGYGAMAGGRQPPCKGDKCLPPPSNPGSRGCESIEKCRHP
ncbi:Uncharacterized protein TCM_012649 [Theobroma cacao]|uniref:Uncharacterized protein n=1 Tax=Theobroma cacao TaxID=3641 RepID=A0A061FUR2_THECC|nr:Uncharacterized protein TCM_012649 [Theobroma cacao]